MDSSDYIKRLSSLIESDDGAELGVQLDRTWAELSPNGLAMQHIVDSLYYNAVYNSALKSIKGMLDVGFYPRYVDHYLSPNPEVWKTLIENDLPIESRRFDLCISSNIPHRLDFIRFAFESGFKPDDDFTGVHAAAKVGNIAVLELLSSFQCRLDSIGGVFCEFPLWSVEATPLMVAANYGQTDAISWLLSHGCSVDAENWQGLRASDFARLAKPPRLDIEAMLLEKETPRDRDAAIRKHMSNGLPQQVLDFLATAQSLRLDAGVDAEIVTLTRPEHVRFITIEHRAEGRTREEGGEELRDTLHLPIFDLTFPSQDGFFLGLLLYSPVLKRFGTYDSSHKEITIFDQTDWGKIAADLPLYLNAQWAGREKRLAHQFVDPLVHFPRELLAPYIKTEVL